MNELINKDSEWIIHFMGSLDRLLDSFEHLTANYRPTLGGERFFTDKEVSARLKVSRRTLQDYRNEGRIAYIQLGGCSAENHGCGVAGTDRTCHERTSGTCRNKT